MDKEMLSFMLLEEVGLIGSNVSVIHLAFILSCPRSLLEGDYPKDIGQHVRGSASNITASAGATAAVFVEEVLQS